MGTNLSKPHIYPYKGRWYVSLYGKEYARPDNRVNVHFPTLEQAVQWVYYPNEIHSGWTKAKLAEYGVPYPPPKGWKKKLQREGRL